MEKGHHMTIVQQQCSAVKTIAAFLRNIHMKRALHEVEPEPHHNFWRLIYGNAFDLAVIDWCILFGSSNQQLHWKQIVPQNEHNRFIKGLLVDLAIDECEWKKYWETVKGYRDKHAAHRDLVGTLPESGNSSYPHMDHAITAAKYYYNYLLNQFELNDDCHRFPTDIEAYCSSFSERAREVAQAAITATHGFGDPEVPSNS